MGQQHAQFLTAYRLHMNRTVKPHPYHLCDATRIVAVRFVDLRLQCRPHVPRLDTDHWQVRFGEKAEQPLRQGPGFQSDPLEAVGRVRQHRQQSVRFARHLHFPNDLARVIHNADARVLDRNVQSSKMVHAALLHLMLEAANADLVSPSAGSAAPKIFSYPQAAGRLPHLSSGDKNAKTPLSLWFRLLPTADGWRPTRLFPPYLGGLANIATWPQLRDWRPSLKEVLGDLSSINAQGKRRSDYPLTFRLQLRVIRSDGIICIYRRPAPAAQTRREAILRRRDSSLSLRT